MNRIINNKRYDTQTAEFICEDGNLNQFGCTRCISLYKSPKGIFFFHHETMWQGEEDTISLTTYEEAIPFAAENMSADKYEEKFGTVEKG